MEYINHKAVAELRRENEKRSYWRGFAVALLLTAPFIIAMVLVMDKMSQLI